jgi:hypothetical protein
MRGDLGEGHVADHHLEADGIGEDLEAAVEYLRPGAVEVSGDGGRRPVGLDPGDLSGGRGEADEVARTAAGFQHAAALEAERPHRRPRRLDDLGRGVVGVEHAAAGLSPGRIAAEQAPGAFSTCGERAVGLVEETRQAAPAGPAGEYGPLVRLRGSTIGFEPL